MSAAHSATMRAADIRSMHNKMGSGCLPEASPEWRAKVWRGTRLKAHEKLGSTTCRMGKETRITWAVMDVAAATPPATM